MATMRTGEFVGMDQQMATVFSISPEAIRKGMGRGYSRFTRDGGKEHRRI